MQLLSDLLFPGEDLLQASAAPAAKGPGPRVGNGISVKLEQEGRAFANAFDAASKTDASIEPLTNDTPAPPAESPKRFAQSLSIGTEEISPAGDLPVQQHKDHKLNNQGYAVVEIPASSRVATLQAATSQATEFSGLAAGFAGPEVGQFQVTNEPSHQSTDTPETALTPEETLRLATEGVRQNNRADIAAPVATVQGRPETGRTRETVAADLPPARSATPYASVNIEMAAVKSMPQSLPKGEILPASAQPLQSGDAALTAQGNQANTQTATIALGETAVSGQKQAAPMPALSAMTEGSDVTRTAPALQSTPGQAPLQAQARPAPVGFDFTIVTHPVPSQNAAQTLQAAPAGMSGQSVLSVPVTSTTPLVPADASVNTGGNNPSQTQQAHIQAGYTQTASTQAATPQTVSPQTAPVQPTIIQPNAPEAAAQSVPAPRPAAQTPAAQTPAAQTPAAQSSTVQATPLVVTPPTQAAAPAAASAPAPTAPDLSAPAHPASTTAGPLAPKAETSVHDIEVPEPPIKTVQQSMPGQTQAQADTQLLFTPGSTTQASSPAPTAGRAKIIADPAIQSQALQQVASAIEASHKGSGRMELRLDPPELGRVSIDFRFDGDNRVTAILHADQPETATLMRRSLDVLMRDLASAGFTDVNVTMGSGGRDAGQAGQQQAGQQQGERSPHSGGQYTSARENETQAQKAPQGYRPAWSADTIDIRL